MEIFNRQKKVRFDLASVRACCIEAKGRVLRARGSDVPVEWDGGELSVAILADTAMADAHRRFLGVRGPTDVITFPYGEILVGAGVAERTAAELGEVLEREICRYIVHGMLHLSGFDDRVPEARRRMQACQEEILEVAWKESRA